jgi:hypothetical protein
MATGSFRDDLPGFEAGAGVAPAIYKTFWTVDTAWPQDWAEKALSDVHDLGVTPDIVLTANTDAVYDDFQAGRLDGNLAALASMIKGWLESSGQRHVLITPFPEANLPEHPWGADPEGFKKSFDKVRSAFSSAGIGPSQVRFVWLVNGGMRQGETYHDYYPGDDQVDIVSFSKLNRGDPWRDYSVAIERYVNEIREQLTLTKPILVDTGSVAVGGNRDVWLRDLFTKLASTDQVIGALYFNRDKVEAGRDNDYRILVDGVLDPVVAGQVTTWSRPDQAGWMFDGRMDRWVSDRESALAAAGGYIDAVDSIFAADIGWLASEGITQGCSTTSFCPDDPVTRGQMAAFLRRALDLAPGAATPFVDIGGSAFQSDISALFASGITGGCSPTRYCPNDLVTRGQMAAFLHRALGATLETGPSVSFIDDDGSVFEADDEWLAATGVTRGCNPPSNTRFCPDGPVTRGQMAAFLHRALG